jgi:hypothetical protein
MSALQCTATAKRTGQRCQKRARTGYTVCEVHGAGKGAKRGGRPPLHGYYSKFLTPAEAEDFAHFQAHFSLDDDLAFAATKVYHAAGQVKPAQLPSLLEVPSKLAERRKRVLEGVTLKLDLDVAFLRGFVAKVLGHVTDPEARQDLLTYLREHLGEAFAG